MDGSLGRQAEKVMAFARRLSEQTKVPIEFRDERLSTVSAKRIIQYTRKKNAGYDDAIAAAIVLQAYLDEKHDRELDSQQTRI